MNLLTVSAVFFVAVHLLVSGTGLRAALVRGMGRWPYTGLFSLASVIGLGAMMRGYGEAFAAGPSLW
jgi:uncharacterized membrane protein